MMTTLTNLDAKDSAEDISSTLKRDGCLKHVVYGGEAGIRTLGAQRTLLISSQARSTAPAPLLSKRLHCWLPTMGISPPIHALWLE